MLPDLTMRFRGDHQRGRALGQVVGVYDWSAGGVSGSIPDGFWTELESIPWYAQWLIPRGGRLLRASVIHDELVKRLGFSHEANRIFIAAAREDGFRDGRIYLIGAALWLHTSIKILLGKNTMERGTAATVETKTAEVLEILAPPDWSNVSVKDHRKFWQVTGTFNGQSHSGTTQDPVALATSLDQAAKASVLAPRRASETTDVLLEEARDNNPELFSDAPAQEPVAEEGEPLPDNLARLVPDSIQEAKRKEWLRARWLELGHKVHAPNVFGLTPAEIREHEELERYRGLFT